MSSRAMRFVLAALVAAASAGCGPLLVWQGRDDVGRRHVALFEQRGRQYLRVDGVDGRRYRAVALEGLTFGPNGRRLAYPALRADGWVVVVDGVESAAYDGIGGVVFSPDGAHVAFSAEVAGGWVVVRDARRGARWDGLARRTLGFGDDQRLSFGAAQGRSVRVVADGRAGPAFDAVTELVRAPRSGRLAYLAYRGTHCGVVIEGREAPAAFELERCQGLRASPSGARVAYTAWRDACSRVFVDGDEVPDSCGVDPVSVRLSPANEGLAYTRRDGADNWVVVDGQAHGPYETAEPVVFAARASPWGFVARQAGRSVVIVDGEERASHRAATDLALSDDGTHVAYLGTDERGSFVAHDGRRTAVDAVLGGTLVLSEDGAHWACVVGRASTRRTYVAVDGRFARALPFDEIAASLAQGRDADAVTAALRDSVRAELARRARR